jgi:hypothetical protein
VPVDVVDVPVEVVEVPVDVVDVLVDVLVVVLHGLCRWPLWRPGGPVCTWFRSPQPQPGRVPVGGPFAKPAPTVDAAAKPAIIRLPMTAGSRSLFNRAVVPIDSPPLRGRIRLPGYPGLKGLNR